MPAPWNRRRSSEQPAAAQPVGGATTDAPEAPAVGKGRPTPRRSEAEKARRRPLVVTDRKAAAKASRERLRKERMRTRTAMESGDERYLPPRDKGPERRTTRDLVDSRRNLGEYLLFAALFLVLVTFVVPPEQALFATFSLWFLVLAVVVDSFVLNRHLKKHLAERFGEVPAGAVRSGVMRALQIRRSRLPKPMVRRGGPVR